MFQSIMQINYLHCRSNSFKEKPFYEDIYSSFFLRGVAVQGIPMPDITLKERIAGKNTISIRKCKRYTNIVEKATITW
ncbi:hypothetical protein V1477_007592 [Vespula maculifrons]|uniref:Uncharacterized protein n=1 Tax=Vespula maculifrons TaxID=7453 RepID=A0ABD2CG91_VESMC